MANVNYESMQALIDLCEELHCSIADYVIKQQAGELETTREEIIARMMRRLEVMKQSVAEGMENEQRSVSGMIGGDARKLQAYYAAGKGLLGGNLLADALVKSFAVSEINTCMGKIVAAPTAGSCGILPAVMLSIQQTRKIPDEALVKGLFTASGFGMVIAHRASLSGAEGGCQAECGSAAAMAAAAAVEVLGGTPSAAGHACAIALKNIMGLVCDPVAGLVEVPCVKRNAIGTANAIICADMALAGVKSVLPVDEVIDAMASVGKIMSTSLKETAEGGLAACPTARRIEHELYD